MKKTTLIILLIFVTLLAVSCGGETPEINDGYVRATLADMTLVFGSDEDAAGADVQKNVYQALKSATGKVPEYITDESDEIEGELVVGRSSRSISRKAYKKLRMLEREDE